jgi:hypothetical protein
MLHLHRSHAHGGHEPHEPHIPGVTEDTVLRPLGSTLVAFGALWAMFAPISIREGVDGLAKAAIAMIVAGLLLAAIGKPEQQI